MTHRSLRSWRSTATALSMLVCASCASTGPAPDSATTPAPMRADTRVKRELLSAFSRALDASRVVRDSENAPGESVIRFPAERMDPEESYCWRINLALDDVSIDATAKPRTPSYYDVEQFYTYALNRRNTECSELRDGDFFYAELRGSPRSITTLRLVEAVANRFWLDGAAASRVAFPQLTKAAPACLRSRRAPKLRIQSLIELDPSEWEGPWDEAAWGRPDGYRFFVFNFDGCELDGKSWRISIYLGDPMLGTKSVLSYKLQDPVELEVQAEQDARIR